MTDYEYQEELKADNMDTDGALRLLSAIFETIRKDYVTGKALLLKLYGRDMSEEEFNAYWSQEGNSSIYIRRYYAAIRSVNRDYYGISEVISATLILDTWDREVMSKLSESERRRVEYSRQVRGEVEHDGERETNN